MQQLDIKQNKKRRSYSDRFKAEIVAQCLDGDESIAAVAMDHDINPNLLHKWITDYRRHGKYDLSQFDAEQGSVVNDAAPAPHNWLAILPKPEPSTPVAAKLPSAEKKQPISDKKADDVNLELSTDKLSLKLSWPSNDHSGLAGFIKELMA